MKELSSQQVREMFLTFFEQNGHQRVPSSSLIPTNDPTLLFPNSGMVQFKDVFLGIDRRDYTRATTAQKSMRVSGKHNDLEDVGPSPRHHTFFEMMGNFSFGDYFKREAIQFAYTLLTEVFQLPADRLVYTVYENDDESYNIWVDEIGIDPSRVARMGASTNFWQMAETGPCGPNSEIHWDKTPELGEDDIVSSLQAEDDRFLEIWNLVFMQFNRTQPDPANTGQYDQPLPSPGVDTGMGFERMVALLQGKTNNYETDLFWPIIEAVQEFNGASDAERDQNIVPYRVIADHVRAAAFLIADGVLPGAKGRNSVCRLVIRRAARFGARIGFDRAFLSDVADVVITLMGEPYPELTERRDAILSAIAREEERFARTMQVGVAELERMLEQLEPSQLLGGDDAFYLKATLGLPIEVTQDIAQEHGHQVDSAGFYRAQEAHSLASGGGQTMGRMGTSTEYRQVFDQLIADGTIAATGVEYDPYDSSDRQSSVVALLQDGEPVGQVMTGDTVEVVLAATPFYVEAGGQVSDTGTIEGDGWSVEVEAMKRPVPGFIVHVGEVSHGTPHTGDAATARIDRDRRDNIMRNHTGTHLLHAALRQELGTHVQQRGSLVAPNRLRFDFSHDARLTDDEIRRIEADINQIILGNYPVTTTIKSFDEAKAEGAMALFQEKYGDEVRTVRIERDGDRFSYELCGGTHLPETAPIGAFVLVSEGSVSAGERRVEALTGPAALAYLQQQREQVSAIADRLGTGSDNVVNRIDSLQHELSEARRTIDTLQRRVARLDFEEAIEQAEPIGDTTSVIVQIDGISSDTMREMADWFRNRVRQQGVLVIGSSSDGKPSLMVSLTDDLVKQGWKAGDIIQPAARQIGGGGGGRPAMAQAGGTDAARLPDALQTARQYIREKAGV